ncbi:MAG: bifunctional chorismate mutase/prephenate dehydratase [Oscillospiraceae bacterium]
MGLDELRKDINKIDDQIIELFKQRMECSYKVAQYKIDNDLPVFQADREKQVIERIAQKVPDELKISSEVLFTTLMDISKCKQYQRFFSDENAISFEPLELSGSPIVAVPGTVGAYSHIASKQFFKDGQVRFFESFKEVFDAVEQGDAEFGVLPIANSTTGSVVQTYSLLKNYDIKICAETKVKVDHCLAVKKGVKLDDITSVYSHEQGLMQCSEFIKAHGWRTHSYSNTSLAACYIKTSDKPIGAICSKACAEELGLEIAADDIVNASENYTKFMLISKKTLCLSNADKVSVSMAIPHTASSLYRMLTKFSVAGLNLLMIESMPMENTDFDVIFYLDFEGKITSPDVAKLINELKSELSYFKFLGNYAEV